jgi:hypothetical protein
MNDAEWQRSADAPAMLDYLFPMRGMDSTPDQPRKLRLYLLGINRCYWSELPGIMQSLSYFAEDMTDGTQSGSLSWAEAEQIAEKLMKSEGDRSLIRECEEAITASGIPLFTGKRSVHYSERWYDTIWQATFPLWRRVPPFHQIPANRHRADLIRCIFGNPVFHANDTARRVPASCERARDLARSMYDERKFDRMPILADLLDDSGCTDHEILDHCRHETLHARGCWVVDLLLGK